MRIGDASVHAGKQSFAQGRWLDLGWSGLRDRRTSRKRDAQKPPNQRTLKSIPPNIHHFSSVHNAAFVRHDQQPQSRREPLLDFVRSCESDRRDVGSDHDIDELRRLERLCNGVTRKNRDSSQKSLRVTIPTISSPRITVT
jgi:hypothetical protein